MHHQNFEETNQQLFGNVRPARLSKATIGRTEYDYIYTKDVVFAPTTAPVGHVRRVPALPDFPGREMTH